MEITRRSSEISFTTFVLGTETSMPDSSTGAVTIKMISSTSTTSTNGVTLISESDVSVRPFLLVNAITKLPYRNYRYNTRHHRKTSACIGGPIRARWREWADQ